MQAELGKTGCNNNRIPGTKGWFIQLSAKYNTGYHRDTYNNLRIFREVCCENRLCLVRKLGSTKPVMSAPVRAQSTPKSPRHYPNRTPLPAYGRSQVASLACCPVGMARCVGSAHGLPSWREGVKRTWWSPKCVAAGLYHMHAHTKCAASSTW